METRASYVLIGVFTLLGIFAGLGFFLWLAKVQIDKTYTQYDILFDQASGLGESSPVRFNGVDVGTVLSIALDRTEESKVRVRIEVSANTPVRQGTEATLSSQGVTGVSFVGLEGGSPNSPRLPVDPLTGVAEIPSKNTAVQDLLEDAPDLLNEATAALERINQFTTPENAAHVTQILANVEAASTDLTAIVGDLGKVSDSLTTAAGRIETFSDKLDGIAVNVDGFVTEARATAQDVQTALGDFQKVMADARTALGHIDDFAENGLPQFTALGEKGSRLAQDISKLVGQIGRDPARFLLGNRTPVYNK